MFRKSSTFSIFRCVLPILAIAALLVFTTALQAQPPEGVTRAFMVIGSVTPGWDPGYMDDNSLMLVVHGGSDTGGSDTKFFVEGSVSPDLEIPLDQGAWHSGSGTEVKHVTKQGFDGYTGEYYWQDDDNDSSTANVPPNGSRCVIGPPDNGGELVYEMFYVERIASGSQTGKYRVVENPAYASFIVAVGIGTFTK
ncbi:hypothetical protein ACFL5Q_03800 [Planctomycetota bacterium]